MRYALLSRLGLAGIAAALNASTPVVVHSQVAALDVMQQAQGAASRIDAEISDAEARLARLRSAVARLREDAKRTTKAEIAYRHSARTAREKPARR
jgi:hypothetical protein